MRDASFRAQLRQRLNDARKAELEKSLCKYQYTGQGHSMAPESGIDGKGHFFGSGMPVSLRHQRTLDSLYEQRLSVRSTRPSFAMRGLASVLAQGLTMSTIAVHAGGIRSCLARLVTSAYLRCFAHPAGTVRHT